jgi:hypothetical protein
MKWSIFDFTLLGVFILCAGYVAWTFRRRVEPYAEEYSPNTKNEYAKNKYQCAYPCGYHRYQSNTCAPQQDRLPITMPDPNQGLPPPLETEESRFLQGVMNGSLSCGNGKQNLCQ